ncbi:hypothetical protein G7046_g4068 [Stylonectria norvegica]|nr:hypothetical protein G7046_g4068 [Stylonectria norvegica]
MGCNASRYAVDDDTSSTHSYRSFSSATSSSGESWRTVHRARRRSGRSPCRPIPRRRYCAATRDIPQPLPRRDELVSVRTINAQDACLVVRAAASVPMSEIRYRRETLSSMPSTTETSTAWEPTVPYRRETSSSRPTEDSAAWEPTNLYLLDHDRPGVVLELVGRPIVRDGLYMDPHNTNLITLPAATQGHSVAAPRSTLSPSSTAESQHLPSSIRQGLPHHAESAYALFSGPMRVSSPPPNNVVRYSSMPAHSADGAGEESESSDGEGVNPEDIEDPPPPYMPSATGPSTGALGGTGSLPAGRAELSA